MSYICLGSVETFLDAATLLKHCLVLMAKQFARAHELMGVAVENEMLTFIF